MEFNPLAFIEFLVVVAFALGWGVLELVGLRLDRKRREEDEAEAKRKALSQGDGPPG